MRKRGNVRFFIRPIGIDLFISKEIFDLNTYHVNIQPNDRVLDCGASTGLFSLYCANKKAQVTAFEPDDNSLQLFSKNLNYNPTLSHNIILIPYPVDYTSTTRRFYFTRNKGNNSFRNYGIYTSYKDLRTADIHAYLPCDVLKVDIEGYEYELLSHVNLEEVKKELALEFHTHNNLRKYLPNLIKHIKMAGFTIDSFQEFGLNGYLHAARN
jgi:FkbM family methyltransferase